MKRLFLLPPALVALGCASAFGQGSLTPPGAPAPTMKTLGKIEARTPIQSLSGDSADQYLISQSGSYYHTLSPT